MEQAEASDTGVDRDVFQFLIGMLSLLPYREGKRS